MQLTITVFLKGTPNKIAVILRKLNIRLKNETGRDLIHIKDEVNKDTLNFKVVFTPIGKEAGEGQLFVIGTGIDVRGNIYPYSTLDVNFSDDELGALRPTWIRIYNDLEGQDLIIRSYSGGIDPLVLNENLKPNREAPLEEWFEWRKREKEQFNRDWDLKQLAKMCGRTHGHVKNVHPLWKDD